MILARFRRKRQDETIDRLYGAIVAQARRPAFYTDYGVPDTAEGRLDMIMLHTVLAVRRLNAGEPELRALGQAIFDRFCLDMDDNLREMGVGDLTVPKKMQRIASAFYGRAKAYEAALADADADVLVAALRRNIYDGIDRRAAPLAAYVRTAVAHLDAQTPAALTEGRLGFPTPAIEQAGVDS